MEGKGEALRASIFDDRKFSFKNLKLTKATTVRVGPEEVKLKEVRERMKYVECLVDFHLCLALKKILYEPKLHLGIIQTILAFLSLSTCLLLFSCENSWHYNSDI